MGHDLSRDQDTNSETWHAQEVPQNEEALRTAWQRQFNIASAAEARYREADARIKKLQADFWNLSRDHANLDSDYEQDRAASAKAQYRDRVTIEGLERSSNQERKAYEQERARFVEEQRQDRSQIAELEAEILRLTQAYEDEKAHQLEQHLQAFEREREKHREVQQNDLAHIRELRSEMVRVKQVHEHQLQQVEQEHNIRYEMRQQELISKHVHETRHLATQVGELNTALLRRDRESYTATLFTTEDLPRKTDATLKASLADIARMVDTIGRIQWNKSRNNWSDETLSRLGAVHSRRISQKAILQDLIWVQLFEHVYASPFRMFGAQGTVLEDEWFRNHSKQKSLQNGLQSPTTTNSNYTWPPASARAERWRYFTLEGCKQALTRSLSQYDPRAALKRGFKENQNELVANLRSTITKFAEIDEEKTLQSINDLAKTAMRMWLDMSMHRPRLVLDMIGVSSTKLEDRIVEVQRGSVALLLQPRLIRYGNTKGDDLNNSTILSEGETLNLQ